ncbi:restriction endonuclease subunit S [Heyndrickxia sporothermodurans]|uniref:restriction endonuclease subunit S n=1 Tax=Heyndrickxia sporothermodurans TaxID=46224 RepID=UPI002E1AD500|nr:restriction endonuclease subunit S [Heyndrickxia sporothermodurans]MED3654293.1 restriction endonuclease subunit S [Heyndrickxia sporothermodurans]MED3782005.1 restriction endonuclease subunit S [Heyndrickxia sporothermodurans]
MAVDKIPTGYKETILGILPVDWSVVRLKDKFDRITTKNKKNVTNVLTISAQHGLINQEMYFNKSVASKDLSNYILLEKGDFAYNKSYSNGYPYGAIKKLSKYDEGVVSSLYICFKPTSNNKTPEFYEHYFEAGMFNHEIHAIAQEGARNHGLLNVSIGDFFNSYIIDADEKELNKIASILSTWDKAIELKEKLIEQKKELKKGLMQKLLTGEVRMPGFEDEWKKVRIKDFCRTYSGGTPNRSIREYYEEGAIPWIKSGELNARKVTKVEEYITELGLKKSSAKLVSPNTLLLALYGATAGVIAKCEITATINQAILAIVPNERCNNNFLFYYLEYAMSEIINTYTQGGQPNLNAEIVKNLLVELPSTEEQNIISLIFMVCDEEIELYTKELEQLKYQKQSLMQQLLTGKVRVKV